jgi:hypothetical protein
MADQGTLRRYEPMVGDYLTDGRRLFQILLIDGPRAVVENCRTEVTGEHDMAVVRKMKLVRRSREGVDGFA